MRHSDRSDMETVGFLRSSLFRLPSCRKGGCRHRSSALSLQTYPPVVNRWYGGQHKSEFGQERSSARQSRNTGLSRFARLPVSYRSNAFSLEKKYLCSSLFKTG